MEKKRIYYLDMAKGIGAILMVLGHVPELPEVVRAVVTSFHMPLFFVLSGIILSATGETNRSFREILKRKMRSIMIPYVVFSVLSHMVEIFLILVMDSGTWETFGMHLFATAFLVGATVFWFLPTLFFGEILFVELYQKTKPMVRAGVLIVLAVLACLGLFGENRLAEIFAESAWYEYVHLLATGFLRVLFATVFVGIGYFSHVMLVRMPKRWYVALVPAVGLLVVMVLVAVQNGVTDMNYLIFHNIILYGITALSGSYGLILLCKACDGLSGWIPARICIYYGRNSLIVMMTHVPFYVLYIATRVIGVLEQSILPLQPIARVVITVVIVLLLEVPVIEVLNRYFSFLLGKRSVKRDKRKV